MRRSVVALLLAALALGLLPLGAQAAPRSFFGIVPQTQFSTVDTARMDVGGIGAIRTQVPWSGFERAPGEYDWDFLDEVVATAAPYRIRVLPFVYSTPSRLAEDWTRLPVDTPEQRAAWAGFLRAAVDRYGPRGAFWAEHPGLPRVPIRVWQIWNEPNFFYFTTPASPARYARLLKISHGAIKSRDRGAKVVIGGLFGRPDERPPRAMPAARFLDRLYRVRGIARFFDGIGLHPYAAGMGSLRSTVEQVRRVALRNRDRGAGLYITEIGWGSEPNRREVAFEVGPRNQAKLLASAYGYLLGRRGQLNLKQVYWFSWKDLAGSCSFCDSVGLFHAGDGLRPKPAWNAFRRASSGRLERRARGRRPAPPRRRARGGR